MWSPGASPKNNTAGAFDTRAARTGALSPKYLQKQSSGARVRPNPADAPPEVLEVARLMSLNFDLIPHRISNPAGEASADDARHFILDVAWLRLPPVERDMLALAHAKGKAPSGNALSRLMGARTSAPVARAELYLSAMRKISEMVCDSTKFPWLERAVLERANQDPAVYLFLLRFFSATLVDYDLCEGDKEQEAELRRLHAGGPGAAAISSRLAIVRSMHRRRVRRLARVGNNELQAFDEAVPPSVHTALHLTGRRLHARVVWHACAPRRRAERLWQLMLRADFYDRHARLRVQRYPERLDNKYAQIISGLRSAEASGALSTDRRRRAQQVVDNYSTIRSHTQNPEETERRALVEMLLMQETPKNDKETNSEYMKRIRKQARSNLKKKTSKTQQQVRDLNTTLVRKQFLILEHLLSHEDILFLLKLGYDFSHFRELQPAVSGVPIVGTAQTLTKAVADARKEHAAQKKPAA